MAGESLVRSIVLIDMPFLELRDVLTTTEPISNVVPQKAATTRDGR